MKSSSAVCPHSCALSKSFRTSCGSGLLDARQNSSLFSAANGSVKFTIASFIGRVAVLLLLICAG